MKNDTTILSVQKKEIFIQSEVEKKERKKIKRLNQKRKFNKMKAKLTDEANKSVRNIENVTDNIEIEKVNEQQKIQKNEMESQE